MSQSLKRKKRKRYDMNTVVVVVVFTVEGEGIVVGLSICCSSCSSISPL